jgi:hypothetical protein
MKSRATYTVGEMAGRIARTGADDEVAGITRQLRNWTGLRLLTPLDEPHQGTGHHRRYDDLELFKAAILELLARNFRVDVTGLQKFARAFDELQIVHAVRPVPVLDIETHKRTKRAFMLAVFGDDGAVRFEGPDEQQLTMNPYELAFVVDLAAIAQRVFR